MVEHVDQGLQDLVPRVQVLEKKRKGNVGRDEKKVHVVFACRDGRV